MIHRPLVLMYFLNTIPNHVSRVLVSTINFMALFNHSELRPTPEVLFKTSLNAAVNKLLLQYHAGTTFPPLYCTALMYRVVKDAPAVKTLM
jgi:hypothetical protein